MPKIGIGIVTYNRLDRVKEVLAQVKKFTLGPYELVVADDGSADGTADYVIGEGVRCITGPNRGVCGNKNRALLALETLGCDPILLVEDDCYPIEEGWDTHWRVGTALWHHLCFAHQKIAPQISYGSGTADDPYVNQKSTAQCASVSAHLLRKIGYLDPRFKGYGVGHAEWTTRAKRAGYGFKRIPLEDGRTARANLFITGGIEARDAPTFKDRENIQRNEKLFEEIKNDALYRLPWTNDEEKDGFQKELEAAGLKNSYYFSKRNRSNYIAGEEDTLEELVGGLQKSRTYRKTIARIFSDQHSFLRKAGWIDSINTNVPAFHEEIVAFNYAAQHFLKSRETADWKEWRVLEFRAGYSTMWWSRRVAEVICIEHDPEAIKLIANLLRPNAQIVQRGKEDAGAYTKAAFEQPGKFQVIVVDGAHRERFRADLAEMLTPGGVIILDNSERSAYAPFRNALLEAGFKEIGFHGIAPMTYGSTVTTVFYRQDNLLGI